MKKLLRSRDILFLMLAGVGDIAEELKDPMNLVSSAYRNMYGFIPRRYKRSNFLQMVDRSLNTKDIEKVVRNDKVYLRLTSQGKTKAFRDFPILNLTKKWSKHWAMVVFDIEEKSKSIRERFRNKLKALGFGMLQKSIWISPLVIGEDMKQVIESIGLSKNAYVLEVSGFIFGNPKELVRRIWNLEKLEEVYIRVRNRVDTVNQLLKNSGDRVNKREAKLRKSYEYDLARKKREGMRAYLEFIANFPPLPKELLPTVLHSVYVIPN